MKTPDANSLFVLNDKTIWSHHEGTKDELKKVSHKEHKGHIGREARKRKSSRALRLNHPSGTAIAVPYFVPFVLFVVESLLPFACGFAAPFKHANG